MTPYVDPAERVARQIFDVAQLFPIQRFVIANTLDGADQIVVLPTGSGKSLCYQVPTQLLSGVTVVVVPLLALLRDQQRRLKTLGVSSSVLHGGQDISERRRILASMKAGSVRVIFVTPEFLAGRWSLSHLPGLEICHFVVDEAHCVAEWGDTFRPAYRELGDVITQLGSPLTTAFTATAAPRVLDRIRDVVFVTRTPRMVLGNPDRPNIQYSVKPTLCRHQDILSAVESEPGATVIFSRTRRSVEQHTRIVRGRIGARDVRFYHAGLSRGERREVEDWFIASHDGVLIASSAYGLGMDKPDIRLVLHAEIPLSVEAYLQESGRAGRDGAPSRAVLLWSRQDQTPPGNLIPDESAMTRYEAMANYARSTGCRRSTLMRLMGQQEPACAGCDVCSGQVSAIADGAAEILGLISRHSRRFTTRQISLTLAGWKVPEITERGYHRMPSFGALKGWDAEDIDGAIRNLVMSGRIVDSRLFGHRLRVRK